MRRLVPIALLATSLSAWGQGSIVATTGVSAGFPGLTWYRQGYASTDGFDIRGDGYATFSIEGATDPWYSPGPNGSSIRYVGIFAVTPVEVLKTYRGPVSLSRGDTIGPTIPSDQFWGNVYGADHYISRQSRANWQAVPGAWSGSLGLSGEFLVGFRLPTPSGYQYGWISVGMTGPDPTVDTPILTGWAYQTQPGQSITAGAVPEPGTLALGTVGSAALLFLKRRKPSLS